MVAVKVRDAVGRRIVAVHQSRIHDPQLGQMVVALDSIELDNGARIVFGARDRHYDQYVIADVVKR